VTFSLCRRCPTRTPSDQKLLAEAARGLIDLHRFNIKERSDEALIFVDNLMQCQLDWSWGVWNDGRGREHITRGYPKWAGIRSPGNPRSFYKDKECWRRPSNFQTAELQTVGIRCCTSGTRAITAPIGQARTCIITALMSSSLYKTSQSSWAGA